MNHRVEKLEWFLLELSSCIGQIFIHVVSKGICAIEGGQTCNYLLDLLWQKWLVKTQYN